MTAVASVLESRFTTSAATRSCQGVWHDLLVEFAKAERIFRGNDHTREADQLVAYMNTLNQHGVRHLERLLGANGGSNGHHTDSTPATEQGPALANETCACVDGGSHEEASASPCAQVPVAVAVPSNDVEGKIELLIDQLGDLMAENRDHQPYEVALKMCHRGRTLAREGKFVLAVRQLRAATNAAHGLKLEVW